MKQTISSSFFITLIFLCCCTCLQAQSPKRELRSAWVTTAWANDWPLSANIGNTTTKQNAQKQRLRDIIDDLHAANFNAISFQVRSFCDAMYKSSYEPWSQYITGTRGTTPTNNFDPLAYAIEYAHSKGMELHAWVNPYRYSSSSGTYSATLAKDYAKSNPEWIMHGKNDASATILNPGIPAVREQIAKVIAEIVEKYDVDGVMFDDYFYLNPTDKPGGTIDSEDATYYANNNPKGLSRADWRRDQVNQMVELVYNTIKSIKPTCRFGISPAGVACTAQTVADKYGVERCTIGSDWQYDGIYSDPLAWLSNATIDYISPQIYWKIGASADYDGLSKWWSYAANQFGRHFYSSHTLSSLSDLGDNEFVNQVALNREYTHNAAPGSIFYSISNGLNSSTFLNTIKTNAFTSRALPPDFDWDNEATTLAAPTNLALSGSTLSWTKPSGAVRFTVYAYTKGLNSTDAMEDPTNLVGVVYGNSITLSNVSGKTLAVCAYDRYGKEHLAAFYNKGDVNPTITASVEDIILTGEKDVTPAPYVDVEITASDLSSSMTYNASTGSVVVTPMDDWNAASGGTLRVTLNTSFSYGVGDYSGILAVQSGSGDAKVRIEIPISATIITPIPAISVSSTSASFELMEGEEVEPQDIIVSAKGLTGDIMISNTNAALSYTCLEWSNKGGTLRLTPDASKAVGTYTGDITLTNGSVSTNISTSVIIEERPQGLSWSKTLADFGLAGGQCRSMAIYGNKLYLANGSNGYYEVNRSTGAISDPISVSGIAYFHGHNLRMTTDGQMLVGNNGASESTANPIKPITVYTVTEATAKALSPTSATLGRADYFQVYGKWRESGYIIALEKGAGRFNKIPFTNGSLGTPVAQTITELATENAIEKAYPIDANSFYASVSGKPIKKVNLATGATMATMSGVTPATSGLAVFTIHEKTYMVVPTDTKGGFKIYNITNGLGSAVETAMTGTALGDTGGSLGIDFCTYIDGDNVHLYVLAPYTGLAEYIYTFSPDPTITTSPANVTLSGEQGTSNIYKDVTITASNLTSDIAVANTNTAVTYEKLSGWNARTGGKLRIKLNTNKSINTYTGNITLTSGTASATISVTGTIVAKPVITASTTSLSLSGEQEANIYQDVTITASNLTSDIAVANTNTAVTYEKLSGWNARTGGKLRIKLNTNKPVDTYSGNITLSSGSANVVITVTGTIIAKPALTTSKTSVALTAEQNTAGIYQDITIIGTRLSTDITIANTNAAVSYECLSGWDDRTGGTLRIHLNTEKDVDVYTGNIIFTSGSLSATIAVTATIEEEVQIDNTPFEITPPSTGTYALAETPLWIKKDTDVDYISGTDSRSIAYCDGLLYIPDYGKGRLYKVNASDGSKNDDVTLGLTSYYRLNVRITDDGQMLGGSTNLTSILTIHTVNKGTGSATALAPTATVGGRSDYFHTYGSWQDGGYALALSNVAVDSKGCVAKIPFSARNLGVSSQIKHADLPTGTSAIAVPAPDGQSFYASTQGKIPTQHDFTGKKIASFSSSTLAQETNNNTSGLGVFAFKGRTYMLAPLNRYGKFTLFDITDGLENAVPKGTRTPAFGNNANSAVIVDFCVNVSGNDAYIYVLAPNNGVAAYKFTFTPDEPTYDAVFTGDGANTNWSNTANWEGGELPTEDDHVLIKQPYTVDVDNAVAKSIHLLKGSGAITIAPDKALTVNGTIRRVENETFPPTARYYTSAEDITIQANASGQGIFVHQDTVGKTRATVQIYGEYTELSDNNVKWQYIATPIYQESALTNFRNSWVLQFDEANTAWEYLSGSDQLELFKGYLLLQSSVKTYNIVGNLASMKAQTITLSKKGSTGENLLGNSWTAPLRIASFEYEDFVGLDATIYLWDYQTGDVGSYGNYVELPIKTSGEVINPLQAFFVVANRDGATITLDPTKLIKHNENGAYPALNGYKAPRKEEQVLFDEMTVRVMGNDKYYCDIRILQNKNYTTGFDNGYDGRKMEDDMLIPYLAGVSTDGDMAVLATPQYDGTYLNFRKGSNGESYTITFTYDGATEYYLEDMKTGVQTAINADVTYSFIPSEDDSYRFRIVSAQKSPDQTTDIPTIWTSNSKLYLTNPLGVETTVSVYSAHGKLVERIVTSESIQALESPMKGVYVIYVQSKLGTNIVKHIM